MRERFEITWEEDIREIRPATPPGIGTIGVTVGRKTMRAVVEVMLDAESAARGLGRKAATSKGKKAIEASGLLVVRCLSSEEVSRRPS
jgi:hypothetical protein